MTLQQLSAAATKLLPCPFCGGEAESDLLQPFRHYHSGEPLSQPAVYCTVCSAQIAHHPDDINMSRDEAMEFVIFSWNTRTGQLVEVQADDATVERVARALAASDGHNPDEMRGRLDVTGIWPVWRSYRDQARAALAAMKGPKL